MLHGLQVFAGGVTLLKLIMLSMKKMAFKLKVPIGLTMTAMYSGVTYLLGGSCELRVETAKIVHLFTCFLRIFWADLEAACSQFEMVFLTRAFQGISWHNANNVSIQNGLRGPGSCLQKFWLTGCKKNV